MTPQEDRQELLGRLIKTVTDYHKMSGLPRPLREDVILSAFNAVADCGFYNRKFPQYAIGKIPMVDL